MAKKDDTNQSEAVEVTTPPAATPMPEPVDGWPADEFTGKGGSYTRDPLTGKRSKAPETPEAAE